jgi:hypothetical protein
VSDRPIPKPPDDLRPRGRGRSFWRSVLAEHEARPDELELLAEVARQLDLLDALREAVGETLVVDGRMHPALVELRQVRQELRRCLAQLALPDLDAGPDEVAPEVANLRTIKARKAARARWDRGA